MKKGQKLWLVFSLVAALFLFLVIAHARTAARGNSASMAPADARTIFNSQCASCHGKDGRASGFKARHIVHSRNLTDAVWQNEVSDERLFNSITNGRNKMPSFKKKLSEAEIEALVAYVRSLKR